MWRVLSRIGSISVKLREACCVMVDEERDSERWWKRWGVRGRMETYVKICIDSLHSLWQELGVICP